MITELKLSQNQRNKKTFIKGLPELNSKRNDGRVYLEKLIENKEVSRKKILSNDYSLESRFLFSTMEERKHSRSRRESLEHLEILENKFSEFYDISGSTSLKTDEKSNSMKIGKIKRSVKINEFPGFWLGNVNEDMLKEAKVLGNELNNSMAEVKPNRKIFKINVVSTLKKAEKLIETLNSHPLNLKYNQSTC